MVRQVTGTRPAPWRLPRLSKLPWKKMRPWLIALIFATGIIWIASREGESTNAPAVSQPIAVPAVSNPQVPQNIQENVGTAAPMVVDYRVVWTEVKGFDPSTIPVEEGLYNGLRGYTNPEPEVLAYAWKILPHLKKDGSRDHITVAAARDQSARDIVLVGITADNNFPYILLSVDGEKSWCKLNLLSVDSNGDDTVATRVASQDGEIHLYAQDPRHGNYWWTATVKKSKLPCS